MVAKGRDGCASGAGFYDYSDEDKRTWRSRVAAVFAPTE
jgi:hypothetical protein